MSETRTMMLLPPAPHKCPICAVAHLPQDPHDRGSLYYQMQFFRKHGRYPTWADAMAHCDEETKQAWRNELLGAGVAPEEFEELL